MSTPSDPDRDAPEIDLTKHGAAPDRGEPAGATAEEAFDPYRFGRPDHPVPPEFAPPGYVPDPPAPGPYAGPSQSGPAQGGPPPYRPPSAPYPYGAPPYGPPHPPAYGQSPYGAPPPGYGYAPAPQGGNGKAVTALVSGIASILLCWLVFFDIVPVALAIIFGVMALTEARRRAGAGKGMAIAGLVCAAIGAILAIVLTVVVVRAYNHCGGADQQNDPGFNQCVRDRF